MKSNILLISVMLCSCLASAAVAADMPSPQEALASLVDGNARFVAGESAHPHLTIDRVLETGKDGQRPFATIIGCSDSRVPIELVMDQGLGDLFIIRVAGNVCSTDEIGSIEYGVDHLNTPLMVVLGHTHCGACTAVATHAEVHGSIPALVAPIGNAVAEVLDTQPGLEGDALVEAVVEENVWQSVESLLKRSPDTLRHIEEGSLMVVGAVYDIETGVVEWLGEHPQQSEILMAMADGSTLAETATSRD
ncbi:carbonic anhydrase [bacterium]|nr:carbonic anhydrase [bacterium]